MKAKTLLTALALASLMLSCRSREGQPSAAAAAPSSSPVRDVVLITIDTLRADAVGFDGNPRGTTPNLDRFASEGRVFTFAHAHNVLTLPSHTNILTGLYPYQHGVRDNSGFRLDARVDTAATMLAAKGFATGAFVAAFPLDSRYGISRGFETYGEIYRHIDSADALNIPQSRAGEVVPPAVDWFRAHAGKPRFLWVHLYDPHAPYDPPEDYKKRFPDDAYLGEVAYADASLAPLLEAVRSTQPQPLLIVTADHGEARGDHGELTHGLFAYESTLHIPLFLWCPSRVPAGKDGRSARHVDILATILDAVADRANRSLPGASLLAKATPGDSYFESLAANFNRGWAPLRGMIAGGDKYIELPLPELYDLETDPGETKNLIATGSNALRRLRKDLMQVPSGPTERGSVGSEEAAALRNLGYLSGSGEQKASYGPQDDPKNLLPVDHQLHEVVALAETGKLDDALRVARKLVAENPKMKVGYENLANLLHEKGDLAGAIRLFEKANANGAGGESMDRRRALLLCESGRAPEAVALLEPYRDGKDTETLNALGIAFSDTGKSEESLAVFQHVREIDPANALSYQNTGIALLKIDRSAEARENLEKALSMHERNPRAWNALGVVWMRLDQPAKALEAWARCLNYDPKQYDALYNTGLVAGRIGDTARARRALELFAATAPPALYEKDIARVRAALATMDKAQKENR